MTFHDFWFLDIAVESVIDVHLVAEDRTAIANRWLVVYHGMSRDEVAAKLVSLRDRGFVCFLEDIVCAEEASRDNIHLTHGEVLDAIRNDDRRFLYGLTQLGGQIWERAAAPNWQVFFSDSYSVDDRTDQNSVTIECTTTERMQKIHGYFERCTGKTMEAFDRSTIRELVPWNATYWKQIPSGVQATFSYSNNLGFPTNVHQSDSCKTFRRWRARGLTMATSWELYPCNET